MPFCHQCGSQVGAADLFCSKCGGRQPVSHPSVDIGAGIQPKTASVLCYLPVVGWIAALVVLASSSFRDNRTARFHAFQGLYLFVAWLCVRLVVEPMFWFPHAAHAALALILQLCLLALSIFMMVKAGEGERYSLPVLGELAERSLAER